MKLKYAFLFFAMMFFQSTIATAQYDSISVDGITRTYLLHLPTNYNTSEPAPLIIAMHGGFGSATNAQNQTQLSVKADEEDFIVVYPEGVKGGFLNIRTWNAGECCGYASNTNIDDVGFIDQLLDSLLVEYAIDETRIYATGLSNGGFMSYRLACELSDRIAAIAPVAASSTVPLCNPERPVPIIQFHSYLDFNVPYEGGVGNGVSTHYNPPHDSIHDLWSNLNNCNSQRDTILSNNEYTYIRWADCDCGTEIEYYITEDGGHSWPQGNSTTTGDPTSEYINASDLMWEFFEQHTLECNTTSIWSQETAIRNDLLAIWPNPSTGLFTLDWKTDSEIIELHIYDSNGTKLEIGITNNELDLRRFPKGHYHLDAILKEGRVAKKLLVK
ncbi:MAG: PHB depolymerase family esterase [Saprospiraceae bacterium]